MHTTKQNYSVDLGLFLIRAVVAVVFIYHGGQKLFGWFGGPGLEGAAQWMESIGIPFPKVNALLASITEVVGAVVLLLGTGTRVAAVPLAFTMLVAIATAHRGGFDVRTGGMEYVLTLGVVLVALALLGPGTFTVTRLFAAVRHQTGASHSIRTA